MDEKRGDMQRAERTATPTAPAAGPPASEVVVRPRLWTRTFVLLCAVSFFCYVHWSLLGPVLPLYIQEHGGSATLVGAMAFAFSVTSFTLRPFLGRLVDTWKIRGVAAIGTLLLTTMSLGYLAYNVVLLLVIRGIHGFGWACYNTGCNTLVSRIAPVTRRGEAVGFMTTAQSIAIAIMPSAGLWLLGWIGYTGIFILSGIAGLLATLAIVAMPRQPPPPPRPPGENFWRSLFEPTALMPSTLHFLSQLPHSLTVTFIPIYATARGIPIESLVFYYFGYGFCGVAGKVWLGRLSDRFGRGWTLVLGFGLLVLAMFLFAVSADIVSLTIAGILGAASGSATSPAGMALAIDRSRPDKRGAAMANYSMAFQMGDGGGALLWGILIAIVGYQTTYVLAALPAVAGLLILARNWHATGAPRATSPA
jgi:predicted MFS family arabinose efflux permease